MTVLSTLCVIFASKYIFNHNSLEGMYVLYTYAKFYKTPVMVHSGIPEHDNYRDESHYTPSHDV